MHADCLIIINYHHHAVYDNTEVMKAGEPLQHAISYAADM